MKRCWCDGSNRERAYLALRAAPKGLTRNELHQSMPEVQVKLLDQVLNLLLREGYAEQAQGRSTPFRVQPGAKAPPLSHGYRQRALLALLRDCPQGMSIAVLAQEAGFDGAALYEALHALVGSGQAIEVPIRTAPGADAVKGYAPAQPEQGRPQTVAVAGSVDMDAVHRSHGPQALSDGLQARFEQLDGGRLRLTYAGLQLSLPGTVVRQLATFLRGAA